MLLFLQFPGLASRYESEYVLTKTGMYTHTGRHYIGSSVSVRHICDKLRAYSRDELLALPLPLVIDASSTARHRSDRWGVLELEAAVPVITFNDGLRSYHMSVFVNVNIKHWCRLPKTLHLTRDRDTTYLHHVLLSTLNNKSFNLPRWDCSTL